jgi:hypothetical protein
MTLLCKFGNAQIVTSFNFLPIVSALESEVVSGGSPISITGNGKCLQVTGGGIGVFTLGLNEQGLFGASCKETAPIANITASFSAYPNPTHGQCLIKCAGLFDAGLSCQLQISGMDGKMFLTNVVTMNDLQTCYSLNLAGYPSGTYLVSINLMARTYTLKLIKL